VKITETLQFKTLNALFSNKEKQPTVGATNQDFGSFSGEKIPVPSVVSHPLTPVDAIA